MKTFVALLLMPLAWSVQAGAAAAAPTTGGHSRAGHDDVLAGGVKMIDVDTPRGPFKAKNALIPAMDPKQLAEVQQLKVEHRTDDPRSMQILMPMHHQQHVLRMPGAQWPEPVTRSTARINEHLYSLMHGPSERRASLHGCDGGKMAARPVPPCRQGSHMAMYADQQTDFHGLLDFLEKVEQG